ncbi:hypothetical protein H1R20_g2985, partial [Candolleomyces eurysporus]
MKSLNFVSGFLTALTYVQAAQVPLSAPAAWDSKWRFDVEPSENATANYIFETISALLQQWPNTRYRNGHSIVPVTIPPGTLLYHGTWQHKVPSVPDWVATDPEHAYLFSRGFEKDDGGWLLTLAAARPLNVLYFDGSSAAKVYGAMDVQDILVWGAVQPDKIFNEKQRINDLCEWGKKYNIDGFLRMELDFEIMLCDFTEGVEVASFLNLVADSPLGRPRSPPKKKSKLAPPPGETKPYLPTYRALEAGHWHNRFPGETRAQLDLTRFISFYDTEMFPSLVDARYGQERWDHRVEKLGNKGRQQLLNRLDEVLTPGLPKSGSGVDWTTLVRVVVQRYADRLEVMQYLLNRTRSEVGDSLEETVKEVHEYAGSMLYPYVLNHVRPNSTSEDTPDLAWAAPVFEQCATAHTKAISTTLRGNLTQSERIILDGVDGVSHEICRIVVGIWAHGVALGLDEAGELRNAFPSQEVSADWTSRVDKLIRWLDWSIWVKCKPECGFEVGFYVIL